MLGAWGEFLGGIAVVMSLIFVGIQVRQSTEASRAATRQAVADSMVMATNAVIEPVTLNEAMADLESGATIESLPLTQRHQLRLYASMYTRIIDNAFYQYQRGMLEAEQWESLRNGLIFNLGTEAGKQWLRPALESMIIGIVNQEFAKELRQMLNIADNESTGGDGG